MSGDLINTEIAIDNRDIFERGYGNFSSKSINELFDVNNDGVVSGEEKSTMESLGLLPTLNSISPLVARAFSDENFRLQTGAYLTQNQQNTRQKLLLAINKAILVEAMRDIPEKEITVENMEEEMLDVNDLMKDIEKRQVLSQGELNNKV